MNVWKISYVYINNLLLLMINLRTYFLKSINISKLILIIGCLFWSCAKTTSLSPITPIATSSSTSSGNTNVDFQYLAGWWNSTDITNPNAIPVRYFSADNVYFFNAVSVGGCTSTGSWKAGHDTLILGNLYNGLLENIHLVKLTKDSLILPGGLKYYRANLPLVIPKSLTTVAGSGLSGQDGSYSPHIGGYFALDFTLPNPADVVCDTSNNFYISDAKLNVVYKVDKGGQVALTVFQAPMYGTIIPLNETLIYPTGLAVDGQGNLYIADLGRSYIRKLSVATGVVTNVAGTGDFGFSGDGGPATSAQLYFPSRIAVDRAGNLYINDQYNNRIRKVNASDGKINTVAGTGTAGFSGNGGSATNAAITPLGVTVDAKGNLYISERGQIRKVDVTTGIIFNFIGTGTPGFSGDRGPATLASISSPTAMAFDKNGNLFIADTGNNCVREVFAADGTINTIAGTGCNGYSFSYGPYAQFLPLRGPTGVSVDGSGNVYLTDPGNFVVRKVAGP